MKCVVSARGVPRQFRSFVFDNTYSDKKDFLGATCMQLHELTFCGWVAESVMFSFYPAIVDSLKLRAGCALVSTALDVTIVWSIGQFWAQRLYITKSENTNHPPSSVVVVRLTVNQQGVGSNPSRPSWVPH